MHFLLVIVVLCLGVVGIIVIYALAMYAQTRWRRHRLCVQRAQIQESIKRMTKRAKELRMEGRILEARMMETEVIKMKNILEDRV